MVRLWGLGGFLTADEPLWTDRARHFAGALVLADYTCPPAQDGRSFAASGLACTLQTPHPGVTTMWAGGLGLLAHYWQSVRSTGIDLKTFLASINSGQVDPALIVPVRVPMAITGALFVCLFYLLLRRLLSPQVALIASLLIALSPFHIALSRVLHHDAMNTTFMTLSLLCMIGYWLRGWRWYWLVLSGVLAGLACLSKAIGWFIIPYAAVVGGIGLCYAWLNAGWAGWAKIWRLIAEGALWGLVVFATYVALFPATWVIPGEVLRVVFVQSVDLAEDGHGYYFLGQVGSGDPGPLFYPLIWLLQASPLEILGLIGVLGAFGEATWSQSKGQAALAFKNFKTLVRQRPVEFILILFVFLFFIFVTASAKKLSRYFLPAFPIIDIFVALGLWWLVRFAASRVSVHFPTVRRAFSSRWRQLEVMGIIILVMIVQGWLVLTNYPYYFTYFNPLFGGAAGAARLITVGWGGGMNEAAAYLNQLPGVESSKVAVCGNADLLNPFFVGQNSSCDEIEIMQSDYVVFYRKSLQLEKGRDTPAYFANHYTPIHRVNLEGLDYVLIYRNPIEHTVAVVDNSLPDMLTMFGYNLNNGKTITLFWRNVGLGHKQLLVGLAPSAGATAQTRWISCTPAPGFEAEAMTPGSIVESQCSLDSVGEMKPGLYDVQLGLGDGSVITPVNSSSLALVMRDERGHFEPVEANIALDTLAKQALPAQAIALDISYGDRLRLAGYQLEPTIWSPSQTGTVTLFWQPLRRPDFNLARAIQLGLHLVKKPGDKPLMVSNQPMLPETVTSRDWARGALIPVQYPVTLLGTIQPGQYVLEACLMVASEGQIIPGTSPGQTEPIQCLYLDVPVKNL